MKAILALALILVASATVDAGCRSRHVVRHRPHVVAERVHHVAAAVHHREHFRLRACR